MKNPKTIECNSTELLNEEVQFLQEGVTGLAEDVMELDEEQLRLIENVNHLAEIMNKASDVAKNTVEILGLHQKEIKALADSLENTYNVGIAWIVTVIVWLITLTALTGCIAYNVFF